MSYGFIRLQWEVPTRGFKIAQRPLRAAGSSILTGEDVGRGFYLEPIGDEKRSYSVGLLEKLVCLELVRVEDNVESVLAFVNKWGPLTKGDNTVEDVIWRREQLRKAMMKVHEGGISALAKTMEPKVHIGSLDVGFRIAPRRSAPEICFDVRSLRAFCWLEMLQIMAGPADILQCKRCNRLTLRPKTGPDPDYCSDACKQAAYRARIKARGRRAS